MVKLTLVDNNGTVELEENAIESITTHGSGSRINIESGSTMYVKEDIINVMQQIVNAKFEGGKN